MNDENEEKKELDLFLPTGYKAPESKDTVVDTKSGKVEDIKNMPPLEQIRVAAQRAGVPINENPKRSCKHCYERGYVGRNADGSPVVCRCMFPPKTSEQKKDEKKGVPLSMLPKKFQRKWHRQKGKQLRKEIGKESTMRELRLLQEKMIKEGREKLALSGTDVSGTECISGTVEPKNESGVVDGDNQG